MKPNQLIPIMLAATALFVASCSTPKLAQNNAIQDDVYNTTAIAKEYIAPVVIENTSVVNTEDNYYSKSDPYYDMDYSSRIDRFYYGNPYRPYYDPFYNYYGYNSFGYNSYYSPYYNYGFSLNNYFGSYYNNWFNPYYNWSYYGSPYYNNYWGPYSYYNPYSYGGGYYGGGYYGYPYYGGNITVRNNENYRPRPNRGGENGAIRADGSIYFPGSTRANNGNSTTSSDVRTRAEMYNPTNNGTSSSVRPGSTSGTPTRSSNGSDTRPTRSNDNQPRPTYTAPPAQQSNPPATQQSSPPPSRAENSSGRPTRSGGR